MADTVGKNNDGVEKRTNEKGRCIHKFNRCEHMLAFCFANNKAKNKKSKSNKHSLPKQYHRTYTCTQWTQWKPICLYYTQPSPLAKANRQDIANATSLLSFFHFSLEAQSPQLLSKEDTFPVGKGGVQQRWHSDARSESTVPGTRLFVTRCPLVTSCW